MQGRDRDLKYKNGKEERQEKPVEAAVQKTAKTSVDSESDQSVIIDGFELNLLSKNQLLGLIKAWIEQAEDRAAEEENEADHEDMPETATDPQTSLDSGIVYDKPKNSSQKATINSSAPPVESDLTPAMSAAGEVEEETDDKRAETNVQNEQPPAKKPKKKMTKEERRLLKNFRQGKKK